MTKYLGEYVLIKSVLIACLAIFLSGCILQSEKRHISDAQAKLLLQPYGFKFANYNFTDGTWVKEEKGVAFAQAGSHYDIISDTTPKTVWFAPLQGTWWLAQFRDSKSTFGYGLVEAQKEALYLHPLACKELMKLSDKPHAISFLKDNCFAATEMKLGDFQKLVAAAGPRVLKLVPEK